MGVACRRAIRQGAAVRRTGQTHDDRKFPGISVAQRGCNSLPLRLPFGSSFRHHVATRPRLGGCACEPRLGSGRAVAGELRRGEMVYRVGDERGRLGRGAARARRHARVRPGLLSGPRGRSRGGRCRGGLRGPRLPSSWGLCGLRCPTRPMAGLVHSTDQGVLYYQSRVMVTSSGSDPRGWRRTCPPGQQTRHRRRSRPRGRRRDARRVAKAHSPTTPPVRCRRCLRAAPPPLGPPPSRPPRRRRDLLRSLRRNVTLGRAEGSVHPVRATTAKHIGGRMGARCSQLPGQGPRVLRLAAQLRQAH